MYGWTDDDYPEQFDKLSHERKEFLLNWIAKNLLPRKSFNNSHTSYGIKQLISHDNEYFTNGEFKGAMLKSGYMVKDDRQLNWVFNVSQKSPIFNPKKSK